MLGRLVRVLFALTAIAPLSISLAYVYAVREHNLTFALLAVLVCFVLALLSVWIVKKARTQLEHLPIKIKKVKSADKEVIGFFIAYALPLIFRGDGAPDIGAWLVAGGMLLFVLFSTHTLQVNPVLGILGFHFYEVETDEGITYLLITRRQINNLRSVTAVVQLSEYGILEAEKTGR
ncbi:MAG: hypothetical protein JWP36_1129 [Paucimonas sp.]|nr:hypothetical protein [Paucimonas sp.]